MVWRGLVMERDVKKCVLDGRMYFGRVRRVGGVEVGGGVFGTLEEDVIYYATFSCRKSGVR